jgi:hypothetical protein
MKAPDKIYINVHPLGVDYSIVPIPDFGGVEYIRKDALLEWARNSRDSAGKLSYTEFIEKIETL